MAIYIMVGVLAVGFVCNLLTRPVDERHHYSGDVARPVSPAAATMSASAPDAFDNPTTSPARLAIAWIFVGIPLTWGVYQTMVKSLALFI